MSGQDNDNKTILGKTLTYPQKVALVKSGQGVTVSSGQVTADGKTTTVSAVGQQPPQGATTYRTINQPQMRLVMPASGTVPAPQIIQTHLMPQAMLKSVDPSGRTQITALPARSLAQTSITVTRSPTPTSFVPRATNVTGARGAVVTNPRTPTPPTANITNFVRNTGSTSRTPSPAAATVISAVPGTTWMSTVPAGVQVGVQGTHLIRASINPSGRPQGRVITQPNPGGNVVTASVASSTGSNTSLQVSQAGGVVQSSPQVSQITGQQTGAGGQILATVQCPRPQTATLVYSNVGNHGPGQPFGTTTTGGGQRLTLSHSRPIRPIQLTATNNRRISIRPPSNVPGLTSTNVLTATMPGQGQGMNQQQQGVGVGAGGQQQGQGRTLTTGPGGGLVNATGIVGGSGPGTANLATRIIQVQPQGAGGTAQVINAGRLSGNLMTLTPVLSQVTGGGNAGGMIGRGGPGGGPGGPGGQMGAGKVQPSLTITHVGKIQGQGGPGQQQQQQQGQMGGGMGPGGHIVVSQAPQQPQTMIVTMGGGGGQGGPMTSTSTTMMSQGQGHQQQQQHHQVMNVVSQPTVVSSNVTSVSTTTMLPLSGITTTMGGRPVGGATGIVRTLTTSQAGSIITSSGGSGGVSTTTLLPLAKVMPQGGGGGGNNSNSGGANPGQTIVETQLQQAQQAGSIFIHSRSPNPVQVTGGVTGASNTGNSGILTLAAATASQSLNNLISGVPYSVQSSSNNSGGPTMGTSSGSSFAVVTNRGTGLQGVIPVATSIMAAAGTNSNSVAVSSSSAGGQQQQTHQIITMTQSQNQQQQQGSSTTTTTTQHIMIPVTTKGAGTIGQSPRPSILRKRDNEGGLVLTANSATIVTSSAAASAPGSSSLMNSSVTVTTSSSGISQIVKGVKNLVPILHAVGTGGANAGGSGLNILSAATSAKMEIIAKERSSGMYVSPPAGSPSDGSTTVSATSSPGVDKQQLQQHQEQRQENELNSAALSLKLQSELKRVRGKEKEKEGGGRSREPSPRKKIKKTNDSSADFVDGKMGGAGGGPGGPQQPGNKENSHPPTTNPSSAAGSTASGSTLNNSNADELRKPRTASLMEAYRHNWKAAHNHFQRHSDVKPREERRPTVIDLANQAHVTQKVNGWKIYHLSAQMEDLCEMESQMYDKLAEMLQCMEAHDQSTDVDRVNELLKGNMQRIKIINDGITESKKQIMKVFDHKSHITDIIHRCGRRNFKKREKI